MHDHVSRGRRPRRDPSCPAVGASPRAAHVDRTQAHQGALSLQDAEDLAQDAIACAYRTRASGGWDPEKGPLENYLVMRVIGSSKNQVHRQRNVCEDWVYEEVAESPGLSVHEKHFAEDRPAPDDALHRLRFAQTFHDRLLAYAVDD